MMYAIPGRMFRFEQTGTWAIWVQLIESNSSRVVGTAYGETEAIARARAGIMCKGLNETVTANPKLAETLVA